ncbi:hypothetical protein JGS22_009750 [Streptomyces sp. P38-E01]|uniref:Secreted protein n=1 Tax=Streptomyces tardus TaxID=2780544 RepID=A0A949N5E1_9ACTN|nr:hypothetical protein [Streptomyces tardus]MBU7597892.1 hypothetical protein [Streptomyces tardus]
MNSSSTRRRRTTAGAAALLGAVVLTTGLTGCNDTTERALDCGKLALSVSRSIDRLERAAIGSALDRDSAEVTEKLDRDVEKIKDRADNADMRRAAERVGDATKDVHASLREDRKPDLSPLKDAGTELTKVCTQG